MGYAKNATFFIIYSQDMKEILTFIASICIRFQCWGWV